MTIKPPDLMLGGFISILIHEAGGSGSLFGWASGFLRKVKNPTATGTRINNTDKHNRTNPTVGGNVCGVVIPLPSVILMGEPLAMIPPHTQLIMPLHPHIRLVKAVNTIPRVRFTFIGFSFRFFSSINVIGRGRRKFFHLFSYQPRNLALTSCSRRFTILLRIAAASASVMVLSD